ncbi:MULTISPECIES: helix-turn-helix domain-containing protein [unclassified Crossiella]|uniref:helix-turn-helix domain-containing protein n=1 Tax=unclassified Crossiella TaxID=2620835 RepID=UPI0024954E79|nr:MULTISPECIES: helix-turn-helix transcriptional regulator [unclassified Crossiella]
MGKLVPTFRCRTPACLSTSPLGRGFPWSLLVGNRKPGVVVTQGDRAAGAELRRLRTAAGLSLTQLAMHTHFSKGYLSKIETGSKRLGAELARTCDGLLKTGGTLTRLISPQSTAQPNTSSNSEYPTEMSLVRGEAPSPEVNRREALLLLAISPLLGGGRRDPAEPDVTLDYFTGLLDHDRKYGQRAAAPEVLRSVGTHLKLLRERTGAMRAVPRELILLDARYSEFAGWMAQEAGADKEAREWTAAAASTAASAGDHDMADYALVRQALVELYAGRARQTVALARQAQRRAQTPPRILALAAQREAQGHALLGDYDSCRRALERAEQSFAEDATRPLPGPVIGTQSVTNPVGMVTGWCLTDLGKHTEAAEILDRELGKVAPDALRTRVRFGVRLALAHARAGELDHACELTEQLLDGADLLASATVAADLGNLRQALHRRTSHQRGLRLATDISHVIHAAPH